MPLTGTSEPQKIRGGNILRPDEGTRSIAELSTLLNSIAGLDAAIFGLWCLHSGMQKQQPSF